MLKNGGIFRGGVRLDLWLGKFHSKMLPKKKFLTLAAAAVRPRRPLAT